MRLRAAHFLRREKGEGLQRKTYYRGLETICPPPPFYSTPIIISKSGLHQVNYEQFISTHKPGFYYCEYSNHFQKLWVSDSFLKVHVSTLSECDDKVCTNRSGSRRSQEFACEIQNNKITGTTIPPKQWILSMPARI